MNKQLIWADIVRIFAIYLIVVLHVVSITNFSQTNFIFSMEITLADICVPLLVMLSGALLLGKKESYQTFIRKRVSRVVIPWIIWTCIFTAITLYFQTNFTVTTVITIFHSIFVPFFWFIILVCSLYAITPALRIFVQAAKRRDILIVVLLWYASLSLLPYMRNTQAFPLYKGNDIVQLVINFIGYFLLGFLLLKIRQNKKNLLLLVLLFIASFIGRSLLEYYSINDHKEFLSGSDFIDPTLVIFSSSLFLLLSWGEKIYQRIFGQSLRSILSIMSRATLGIYFVHYLFLNRAPLPTFIDTNSFISISYNVDIIINALILFIISFFIIFFLMKVPYIKNFIT